MLITKEILRFEHKDTSIGPYNNRQYNNGKLIQDHMSVKFYRQPVWNDIVYEHQYFGFVNVGQLINWFDNDELEWLFENDYNLKVYQIDSSLVNSSAEQCVFVKQKATQLKVITAMEEFEKFFFEDDE